MAGESEKETLEGGPTTFGNRVTLTSKRGALEHLPIGTELGRYIILELRGAGGMGVVYSAYDPKLDRRVALKLLRGGEDDPEDAGARLLKEAQALAKLAHPNVVTVHDAGMLGDVVFVEMEYVDGVTLEDWARGRPTSEVLRAYLDAGRALAAAHVAGLVHRDFKPTNAIVDESGRVRVLDFGLARPVAETGVSLRPPPPSSGRDLDEEVVRATPSVRPSAAPTLRGMAVGTPAYMPPEQWQGRVVDARADQYAFAASLFEALCGEVPFPKATRKAMQSEATRGPMFEPKDRSRLPTHVARALTRALAFAPSGRFASMDELLAALARNPTAIFRRRALALFAAVAVVVLGVLGYRHERTRDARACSAMDQKLQGAWDEEKKQAVAASLTDGDKPGAHEAWARTKELLDGYAQRWVALRTGACLDARSAKGVDAAVADRLVCLDWRMRELRALTDVLASDSELALEAVQAVSGLVPVEECANASLRTSVRPPEDPGLRAHVDAIRARLADAESRRLAARLKSARPIAEKAVEEARASKYLPVEGLAELTLGRIESDDGQYPEAAAALERATWAAEASRDDETLVAATTALAMVVGYRLADHAGGARWEKHAVAALDRFGGSDALGGELEHVRSSLARRRQDLGEALAHAETSLTLLTRAHGPQHPKVAAAEQGLGNTYMALARWDEATTHFERARQILEATLGASHPSCATPLTSEAILARKRGDHAQALVFYRRALAILEPARGPDHPDVALIVGNMGIALYAAGKLDEARSSFERSLAIRRKVYGTEHPLVASSLVSLASVDRKDHRFAEAHAKLAHALQIQEKTGGRENPALGSVLISLAELSLSEKKPKEARAFAERVAAMRLKKLGPLHPDNGPPLTIIARCDVLLGKASAAVPLAEHAVELLAKGNPGSLADARFALAQALGEAGRDRARARELAQAAEATYEKDEEATKDDLETVRAWLAAHR